MLKEAKAAEAQQKQAEAKRLAGEKAEERDRKRKLRQASQVQTDRSSKNPGSRVGLYIFQLVAHKFSTACQAHCRQASLQLHAFLHVNALWHAFCNCDTAQSKELLLPCCIAKLMHESKLMKHHCLLIKACTTCLLYRGVQEDIEVDLSGGEDDLPDFVKDKVALLTDDVKRRRSTTASQGASQPDSEVQDLTGAVAFTAAS